MCVPVIGPWSGHCLPFRVLLVLIFNSLFSLNGCSLDFQIGGLP